MLALAAFSCQSVPWILWRAAVYLFLTIGVLAAGKVMSPTTPMAVFALFAAAFWPAMLAAFWIQWHAASHVGADIIRERHWQWIPPGTWLAKVAPLAIFLAVALYFLVPFGAMIWPETLIGYVVWPIGIAMLGILTLLTVTGLSSVATAQEVDADMSGYSHRRGLVFQACALVCLIVAIAIGVVLAPLLFMLAMMFDLSDSLIAFSLATSTIIVGWSAGSVTVAFLLEDRLWHNEFYS